MISHRGPKAVSTSNTIRPGAPDTPGKRTLTEGLVPPEAPTQGSRLATTAGSTAGHGDRSGLPPIATVQRAAAGIGAAQDDPEAVHQAAAAGTSGPAGQLPHADIIQGLFGRHDIGGIRAHTGPAATAGARAMGAEAFATGEHVAFAGTPSLHTAAHEAAHVVQQRAGVHLKSGVGATGDRYEQHADRVADAVVQGRSSEALLDEVAGPTQGPASGAIQMLRPDPAENDRIATVQWRLLKAFDFDLAEHAIRFRIDSGELDTQDLRAIRDNVTALGGGFDVVSEAAVGRATNEQQNMLRGKMQNYREFLDGIVDDPTAAETLRNRGGEEVAPGRPETEEGWIVIRDEVGRRRIEVPTAKADGVEVLPLSEIKWSQKDVKKSTNDGLDVTAVIGRMNRGGWRGDPLEVVDIPARYEGAELPEEVTGRCSMDNRRLVAATVAGLSDGPARLHAATEAPDREWAADPQNKLRKDIWQHPETKALRVGGDRRANGRDGYAIKWTKDTQPTNYAEMILYRTANQGNLKYTSQSFPVGGSDELPFVRE
jgi:hypothetical protein